MKMVKNNIVRVSIVLSLLMAMCGAEIKAQSLPDLPIEKGVSAPFAGIVDGWLVVYGGCNFPDVPAADGGKKVFYSQGWARRLDAPDSPWQVLPQLPTTVAYGATAVVGNRMVMIGGQNANGQVKKVWLLTVNGSEFALSELPELPEGIDNGSATAVGDKVYVTGGNQSGDDVKAMYVVDVKHVANGWQKVSSYIGAQRSQPVLTATKGKLYLASGFAMKEPEKNAETMTSVLAYDIATDKWQEHDVLPKSEVGEKRCFVGGSGIVCGDGTMVYAGGVNYDIFKNAVEGNAPADYMRHEPEWYKFNREVWNYNPTKKSWTVIATDARFARAGGILLKNGNSLLMVCGETKPGIRSAQVNIIEP